MSSSVSGLATDEPSSGSGYSDLDFASDGEENDEFANDEEEAADGTPRRRKSALAANRPPRKRNMVLLTTVKEKTPTRATS